MKEEYNVAVLGGGPGGYVAAILAARLGAKVILIEKNKLGGTCLNAGCIPTKALLKCAAVHAGVASAGRYGVEYESVYFDFRKMMEFKNRVVDQLVGGVNQLIKANKIDLIIGEGRIINRQNILVKTPAGNEKINAQNIIVATGAQEVTIPGFEPDGDQVLNSTQILSLQELPRRLTIIGGGVIGVEFASLFNSLGVEVTILELTDRLIPTEDEEISQVLQGFLEKKGVKIQLNILAQSVEKQAEGNLLVRAKPPDGSLQGVNCDKLLVSVGRKACFQNTGLIELGVRIKEDRIVTDEHMQTNISGIYAVGDITLSEQLAHVAYMEARTAVFNIKGETCNADYTAIPHCIYTSPEVAGVGLSEQKARELYGDVKAARFPFYGNGKAIIDGHNEGFVKIVFRDDSQEIVGASIIGTKATELITGVTLAVQKKMKVMDIVNTVYAHPTLSEALGETALAAAGLNLHSV